MLHVILACFQELHVCHRGSCGHVLDAGQSADRCCGRCYKCCRKKPQKICASRDVAIQTTQHLAGLAAKGHLAQIHLDSASDSSDDSESELDIGVADTARAVNVTATMEVMLNALMPVVAVPVLHQLPKH